MKTAFNGGRGGGVQFDSMVVQRSKAESLDYG
jgi:hypothetical protein